MFKSFSNRLLTLLIFMGLTTLINIFFQYQKDLPEVKNGYLDLSDWDFKKNGMVELKGEWLFEEGIQNNQYALAETKIAMVPGEMPIETLRGSGTYYLKIKMPKDSLDDTFALNVQGVRMSNALFINDKLIHLEGVPADKEEAYIIQNIPYYESFIVEQVLNIIKLQVSNYDYYTTGIHLPIYIGTDDIIEKRVHYQNIYDTSTMVMSLAMSFIYTVIYFSFERRKAGLILALYFLTFALFLGTTNQKIIVTFFNESFFTFFIQLRDIAMYMLIPIMIYYIKMIFPKEKNKLIVLNFLGSLYIIYCLICLIVPYHIIGGVGDYVLLPLLFLTNLLVPIYVYSFYKKGSYSLLSRVELEYFILFQISQTGIIVSSLIYYANIIDSIWLCLIISLITIYFILRMFIENIKNTHSNLLETTERLKQSNKLKDEFLFKSSNELKTPLQGIINIAQASINNKNDIQRIEVNFKTIKETALRMDRIINDLVDLTLISTNKFNVDLKDTDIYSCVRSVIEVLDYQAREKKVLFKLRIDDNARMTFIDESRLIQVLFNLVINSLQSMSNGEILICVSRQNKNLKLSITDSGMGIEQKYHQHIFEPYFQGESQSNKGGLGLGLTISKQLIEQMNGELYLEWSKEGIGTMMSIDLPLAHTDSQPIYLNTFETPTILNEYIKNEDLPVVCIISQEINRKMLKNILVFLPCKIVEVSTSAEILHLLTMNNVPDIILLDVLLSDGSGYDVAKQIRESFSLIELPILFITSRHFVRNSNQAFLSGGNDIITNPFEPEEIRTRISTLLAIKKISKQAMENELAFLQSQIKPHFLFNTLSTIISYSYEDSDKTRELLQSLSIYLRSVFQTSQQTEWVTIESELDLTQAYVQMELQRFSDRLSVQFIYNESVLNYLTPRLLLQPIVENAITHGVLKKELGGNVLIKLEETDGIFISVIDNGIGISEEKMKLIVEGDNNKLGIGVLNVNRRLKKLTNKELIIQSKIGKGTSVSYWLPFKRV